MTGLVHVEVGEQLTHAEYHAANAHGVSGGVAGDMLYFDGVSLTRLPIDPGPTSKVLSIVGGLPQWIDSYIHGDYQIGVTIEAYVQLTIEGPTNIIAQNPMALTVSREEDSFNYAFQVDTSDPASVTGIKITSAISGGTSDISAIGPDSNINISLTPKGVGAEVILDGNALITGDLNLPSGNIVMQGGHVQLTNHELLPSAFGISNQFALYDIATSRYPWWSDANDVVMFPQGFLAQASSQITGNLVINGTVNATGGYIGIVAPGATDIDMQSHLIYNIGNPATDFTGAGGLNLAGDLNAASNVNITGNVNAANFNLNGLPDVVISSPSNNQTLTYDSASGLWKNTTPPTGVTTLDGLSDVTLTNVADTQILRYNSSSSQWINTAFPASTWVNTATSNLDMANLLITNIGNAGTDFTSGGGLILAGALTVNGVTNLNNTLNTGNIVASGSYTGTTISLSGTIVASNFPGNLDSLTDVVITAPANAQILAYNGTNWVNTTNAVSGVAAGNLDMANYLITNIGNAGTDFTASGGLVLAGSFTANNVATVNATVVNPNALLQLTNNDAGQYGVLLTTTHATASPAANDYPFILTVQGRTVGGGSTNIDYGRIWHAIAVATNGNEQSYWMFETKVAGGMDLVMTLDGNGISTPKRLSLSNTYNTGNTSSIYRHNVSGFTLWGQTGFASNGAHISFLDEDGTERGRFTNTGFAVTGILSATGALSASNFPGNLDSLTDVIISAPANSQVLSYNGTNWINAALPTYNLDSLTDVIISAPANTQVLTFNGTNWVNAAGGAGGWVGTATSDLNMGNFLVTNIGNAGTDFTTGGGLTLAGDLSAATKITITANSTGAAGSIYKTAADGLVLRGITGSTNDLNILNNAGSSVMRVVAGTQAARFADTIDVTGCIGINSPNPMTINGVTFGDQVIIQAVRRGTGTAFIAVDNPGAAGIWLNDSSQAINTRLVGWEYSSGVIKYSAYTDAGVGTARFTIDSAGRVGVGSTAPMAWVTTTLIDFSSGAMTLRQNGTAMSLSINMYNDGSWRNTTNTGTAMYTQGPGTGHLWYSDASPGAAGTIFSPTTRMILDLRGKLGIGATPNANHAAADYHIDFNGGAGTLMLRSGGMYNLANMYIDGSNNWKNTTNAATSMFGNAAGNFYWYSNASPGAAGTTFAPTLRMQLDNNGHLGLLGAPFASWMAAFGTIEFAGSKGSISWDGNNLGINQNLYYDGSNWRNTINSGIAQIIFLNNGSLLFYAQASPGAAGSVASLSAKLTIDASGIYLDGAFTHRSTTIGFYNATPTTKPNVTGAKGSNAALGSLMTALATLGLVTNSTTA